MAKRQNSVTWQEALEALAAAEPEALSYAPDEVTRIIHALEAQQARRILMDIKHGDKTYLVEGRQFKAPSGRDSVYVDMLSKATNANLGLRPEMTLDAAKRQLKGKDLYFTPMQDQRSPAARVRLFERLMGKKAEHLGRGLHRISPLLAILLGAGLAKGLQEEET